MAGLFGNEGYINNLDNLWIMLLRCPYRAICKNVTVRWEQRAIAFMTNATLETTR